MNVGLTLAALIAFCVFMSWAGARKKLLSGGLASVPFFALMLYLEFTTSGSFFTDPYGDLLLLLIFTPLLIGWVCFGIAYLLGNKSATEIR